MPPGPPLDARGGPSDPAGAALPLDCTAEVETPEHVRFRYRLAGPARRAVAYLLDLLIRIGCVLLFWAALALAGGPDETAVQGVSRGVMLVFAFALEWGYYVLFETTGNGRTPGKRALGLRVIKEGGFPIGFADSVLRNLLRAADFLPAGYALGLLAMVGDRRFRRLGDRVAGTMVVVEERGRVAEPLVLSPPPAPGELEALPHAPSLSPAERESLELFLRRRDLSPARRAELAELVAPLLARRHGVTAADPVRYLALLHARAQAGGAGPSPGARS
jgi:uncharacterized RDD family membrane protein YckC